ncbi:hypothetical protein [Luteolibacter luteus]|uniref:DUF4175 family protein n=1 Tax=Luteolibacter luteus TaxID=2728835 RepID=A0A858REL1_9BACT|nr:hypothetical protein [Luteolibacter luteus]QJE94603.1 hypothetical protein HHL09_01995 [Luteolibacter luteus]
MADDPQTPVEIPIPESLRKQLDDFRRQLWRAKIAEAVLAGFFGLLFSFLLVFALDRVWQTPALLRLAILIGGTSLMAIFAPLWMHRWVWKHRRENQLARLIAKRFPGLGDRLLGVVELQQQVENSDTLSPRLRAAAMQRVAEEAERRKLEEALPASRQRTWFLAVVALFLTATGALIFAPKAGISSLKRWLMPLSQTQRYTFTALEATPAELPVPQGEAFSITLKLAKDTEWYPASGVAKYGRQDPVFAPLSGSSYEFQFPAQQDPGIVKIEIGDAKHLIKVVPTLRPAIRRVLANLKHPDYLQIPNREIDLGSGVLSAVEGSKVSVTIDATRELALASYQFGPLESSLATPAPAAELRERGEMSIHGASASTPPIEIGKDVSKLPIQWTDQLGLKGEDGFEIRVDALPDEAPGIYIQGLPRQHVMLPEETVDFEVLSEDDFGIRRIGLEWSGEFTRATDEKPASGEIELATGGPAMNRLSGNPAFSPQAYQIRPQKLTLRAWAEDYMPGRQRAFSEPVTLFILTHDEHAQMLKTQFDRAIGELEDLARRERNLYEENQRLERLAPEDLRKEENLKRLEAQQEAEKQQAERMKDLAEKMEKLFKDSTRNGTIDKDTLKKMAEAQQSMRELAEKDMPEVEKPLGDAQDQRNTDEKSKQDVEKAVQEQKEALEKMQEALEKANDANQRFEASTFVNRLKKAASEQEGVGISVWDSYAKTGGLSMEELDPSDSGKLQDTMRQQANITSDVRWIQEDLNHFFTRTNKEEYRKILDAMTESRIDLKLEDLRLLLDANHGYRAREEADIWANKLKEWAKMLEGEQQSGGGGGGGGGGENQDEDFEFMLRVMKMIQQEQDLRARTRALETLRRSYDNSPNPEP